MERLFWIGDILANIGAKMLFISVEKRDLIILINTIVTNMPLGKNYFNYVH